ncbi:MAG: hypothetical protein V9G98_12110 [Candidatus Competibacter sp.]
MRRAFQARRAAYEAAGRTLVWIDESGFARDMPRRFGYAPVGQRCHGRWDWHAKGRTNGHLEKPDMKPAKWAKQGA